MDKNKRFETVYKLRGDFGESVPVNPLESVPVNPPKVYRFLSKLIHCAKIQKRLLLSKFFSTERFSAQIESKGFSCQSVTYSIGQSGLIDVSVPLIDG